MKKRILDIANDLAAGGAAPLSEIAVRCGVSERTVREDIKILDAEVRRCGAEGVRVKRGIVESGEGFADAVKTVSRTNFYDYRLGREERVLVAAELLVNHVGYLTLLEIADVLCVSRATVINDLPDVKREIARGALIVASHPSKGLCVTGPESLRRRFLLQASLRLGDHVEGAVLDIVPAVPASRASIISKIVSTQETNHARWLTDDSFKAVTTYLDISVNRCLMGQRVEDVEMDENAYFPMARDIMRFVSQYCGVDDSRSESLALAGVLGRMQYLRQEASQNDAPLIQLVTHQFIEAISDEIGIDLNGDFTLFECLANHLESTMAPEPVDFPDTDVIREIIVENDEIFQAVLRRDAILRSVAGRQLTNLEVGYIVLHLCAAIERKAQRGASLRIVVACNAGVGTSQLLLAKLNTHFEFRVVDTVSSREAERLEVGEADLVISTINLEACPIEWVCVSPLLNEDDRRRINAKVDKLRAIAPAPRREPASDPDAKGLIQALSSVVYDVAPDMAPALMRRIRPTVRRYFEDKGARRESAFVPYLHQLLMPSHIVLDAECGTWEDAIRASAQPLLEEGYVEERYVDAMIESTRTLGPYAVLSDGFAMPHAGLDQGSIEVGMTFMRLARPVEFGAKKFDPVRYVCCLSAIDKKTHIKALFALLSLMCDQGVRKLFDAAETPDDVVAVLRRHEYDSVF